MALGKPDAAITFDDYADQFVGHVLKQRMVFIELMWFSTATRNFPSKQAQGSNGLRSYVQLEGLLRIEMTHFQNSGQTTWHLRKTRLSYLHFSQNRLYLTVHRSQYKIIVVAGGFEEPTMVKTNSETLNTKALEITHEEADTWIIVHCIHSSAETRTRYC